MRLRILPLSLQHYSWIGVLPGLLISYGVEIPEALKLLDLLIILGPILGAVIFIARTNGIQGLKQFFRRLLFFRAGPLVLFVAIVTPILVSYLGAALGLRLSDAGWPDRFTAGYIISNGLIVFAMYLFINTEELVWRGIVFDQLYDRYGFGRTCLILGPIWWLFHMPLFLYANGHQAGYGLAEFTLIVIAQTVVLGWIYINSRRSLFYVHVQHQLLNGFGQAFPSFPYSSPATCYPCAYSPCCW